MDMVCQMAIKDWRSLNSLIGALNEEQIHKMLEHEVEHSKRSTFVVRMHQKLTALRAARERADLIAQCVR